MCARSTVCKMYIMDLFIFKHNVIHAFNVYIAAFTNYDAISKFYAFSISASTHSLTSRIPGMSLRLGRTKTLLSHLLDFNKDEEPDPALAVGFHVKGLALA
jgi:hypothetical protein